MHRPSDRDLRHRAGDHEQSEIGQIDTLIEGHIGKFFGSAYAWDKCETLLRSSISMNARGRDDLSGIGKTPDMAPGFQQRQEL